MQFQMELVVKNGKLIDGYGAQISEQIWIINISI